MNCGNCGTPLIPGNNVCPNCGALNEIPEVESEDIIELDETPKQVDENIAPPTLEVANESSMIENVGDLNDSNDSIYEEDVKTQVEEENENVVSQTIDDEGVDIEIPKAAKPVEPVDLPLDGSAPVLDGGNETITIGPEETPKTKELAIGKTKIKINMGKSVPQLYLMVGCFAFLVVGLIIGKFLFSKNYCNAGYRPDIKSVKYVSDGKNNVTNVKSYSYKIPKDYTYDKKLGGLLVYSTDDKWRIFIRSDSGSYNNISGAKNSIRETIKETGFQINELNEVMIKEKEFLVIKGTTISTNRMLVFTDAGHDNVFYMEIITDDDNYSNEILEVAADIASNAEFKEAESKMENVDVYDVSEITILSANKYKDLISK